VTNSQEPHDSETPWWKRLQELIEAALAAVALLAAWLLESNEGPAWVWGALYAVSFGVAGYGAFLTGLREMLRWKIDVDFLMVVAALGAAAIGDYAEGAMLLVLFAIGHGLEHYAMGQARKAIRSLGSLTPRTAWVRRGDDWLERPIGDVSVGDRVRVRAGERVPMDGEVAAGNSSVDQSPITGESVPVEKGSGDQVFAGTLNGDGLLEIAVSRIAGDSTVSRMIRLVEEAQSQKSTTQRYAEKFTRVYVPVVLVLTIAMAVVPPMAGLLGWPESFLRAMTLLVGASPCALAISTPAAVLAGVARGARAGVLIKGGAYLETLGTVRCVAVDKTGTLTVGRPAVREVLALDGSQDETLGVAAALENHSTHPLARAVLEAVAARGLAVLEAADTQTVRGKGLTGTLDGERVAIGALRLFDGHAAPAATPAAQQAVAALESRACTVMLVARGSRLLGAVGLMDGPRREAAEAVAALHTLGVRPVVMLTGDNAAVGEAVGRVVGVDEVRAGLMPEDKIEAVRALTIAHGSTAMVGDGINDAPALAAATVGIAMGRSGTDVALEAADVALMSDDLMRLPFAIGLSRASRRIVAQNVMLSMGMVATLIPLAAFGIVPIWMAVILHEGSTVAVVLNSLRLLGYRQRVHAATTTRDPERRS
jgi:Zn2+/Cd2+-exporting ATPase